MTIPTIAIDTRRTFGSGIGRYTSCLIDAFSAPLLSSRFNVIQLSDERPQDPVADWCAFEEPILTPWSESGLADLLIRTGADLFISPQYYTSADLPIPQIRVLHDAHPFWGSYVSPTASVFEALYGRRNLEALAEDVGHEWRPDLDDRATANLICAMYRRIVETADALLTVSDFSAGELGYYMPETAGRWQVIYPFVSGTFSSPQQVANSGNALRLLVVSKLEPRKRQLETMLAVERLRRENGQNFHLTLVGGSTASFPEYGGLVNQAANARVDWVDQHVGISDHLLSRLYAESDLNLFPSLSEGFGFPAVEAMHFGKPLLASSGTSLMEVCGDCAYFLDEHSDSLEEAIFETTLLLDQEDEQSALRRRRRAQGFSQQSFADGLFSAIRALL